jgi:vacuolar protein sorting-associated protein 54
MREIPEIYFQQDFDLSDPDTFAAACPDDRDVSSMSMVMQERLSHHLDVVEVHLLREIGSRSESFFEALGVLQELNAAIESTCDRIAELRHQLAI